MAHTRLLALAMFVAVPCLAADNDYCSKTSSVSDARLELSTKDHRGDFQQGEIVPLVLSFTASAKGRYSASTRNYDRSGRLDIETYCLEPSAPDPLESYFRGGSFMGGGLGGAQPLGSAPYTFEAELNEYAALAPGRYRLFVVSPRAFRNTGKSAFWGDAVTLRSNTVEFTVTTASAAWQKEQLTRALEVLAQTPYKDDPFHPDEKRLGAGRLIRYLNTRDSARALAGLLTTRDSRDPVQWEIVFGLYGSPYRKAVLQAMHDQLALPGRAISEDFLNTLANLEVTSDAAWDPPAYDAKTWSSYQRRREARLAELLEADAEELLSALPRKTGSARAESAAGLLRSERRNPELVATARRVLIDSWSDLPALDREEMIDNGWDLMKGPEMIPLLAGMAGGAPLPSRPFGEDGRELALKDLAELDPSAAGPLILKTLDENKKEPSIALLKLLPASEMGRALAPAIDRIAQDDPAGDDFERVERFGGPEALSAVKAYYETHRGQFPCKERAEILRYMVRVEPGFGVTKVTESLHAAKGGGCISPSVLSDLEDQLPAAETIAIDALNDSDEEIARDAARALGKWGSPAAEAPLWARMRGFHDQWEGRAGELARRDEFRGNPQARLENSLVDAIGAGANWICLRDELVRLRGLALTKDSRSKVDGWIDGWAKSPPTIEVAFWNDGGAFFSLGPFFQLTEDQLTTRLKQLPGGTSVAWELQDSGETPSAETLASLFERVRGEADKNGVKLVKTAAQTQILPE